MNVVISLKRETKRREHIQSEFLKYNLDFEFFDAITPDIMDNYLSLYNIDIKNSPLTKGEIACALSHITLWHKIIDEKLDYLAIFEDDIYLGENTDKFLKCDYISDDVHVLKLEKHLRTVKTSVFSILKIYERKLYRLKTRHVGMGGYIMTYKGAKYILERLNEYNLSLPIDDIIFDVMLKDVNYKVLQLLPAICVQDFIINEKTNFISSLEEERSLKAPVKTKNKSVMFKLKREILRPINKLINFFTIKKVYFK